METFDLLSFFYFFATFLGIASGNFDFEIGWCRFKWGNAKESKAPKVPGFYWRDFYNGVVPSDAFSLSSESKGSKTYIGLVLDKEFIADYATTIVEGKDSVYTVQDGKVHELNEFIQILCTEEPEKMNWVPIVNGDKKVLNEGISVEAGWQKYIRNKSDPGDYYWSPKQVVRVSEENEDYAGSIPSRGKTLSGPLEYASMDGSPKKSTDMKILLYQPNSTSNNAQGSSKLRKKKEGFFDNQFEYNRKPGSLIPHFYEHFKLGPFSLTCTNWDKKKDEEKSGSSAASDYFWVPKQFFNASYALESGKTGNKETSYLGQVVGLRTIGLDYGYTTDARSVDIVFSTSISTVDIEVKILSTFTPEKLKWMPTTYKTMKDIDKTKLFPGMKYNGTRMYAGRTKGDDGTISPGSVHIIGEEAYIYAYGEGPSTEFEVLSHA